MVNIDELSALLFNGTREEAVKTSEAKTTIIYGTALADSSNGLVQVQLDNPVYSEDDLEDQQYIFVSLSEEVDDVASRDEDDQLVDVGDDEQEVYWQLDDDLATQDQPDEQEE